MTSHGQQSPVFGLVHQALLVTGATVCFDLTYSPPALTFFVLGYVWCLIQLARCPTARQSFYSGMAVGLLTSATQLFCFWSIFGPAAVVLWLILGFWIGLFTALARLCLLRFRPALAALAVAVIWTGLEYFRSELYYLRFSWLNIGYAFSESIFSPVIHWLGMYGLGFLAVAIVAAVSVQNTSRKKLLVCGISGVCVLFLLLLVPTHRNSAAFGRSAVKMAGVQLEFPDESKIISSLNQLLRTEPGAKALVLSEYTLTGPVPKKIKDWCREHKHYLIIGGEDPAPKGNYYDTAFVIGPDGGIEFRQAKAVPIQFFKDGLPAREQKLWNSPWGKIGICICYDLSYTRVTDALVRQGAQALIVPTMDVVEWGKHEHELHARVAPIRSAEYGIPIFRVASSGISQLVDRSGKVRATGGFPGQSETLAEQLELQNSGTLPLDRRLAPIATGVTVLLIMWFTLEHLTTRKGRARSNVTTENKTTSSASAPA